MTSEGLGEMFKVDSADIVSMGGRANKKIMIPINNKKSGTPLPPLLRKMRQAKLMRQVQQRAKEASKFSTFSTEKFVSVLYRLDYWPCNKIRILVTVAIS